MTLFIITMSVLIRGVERETQCFLSGTEWMGRTIVVPVMCQPYSVTITRPRSGGQCALGKGAAWWKRRLSWIALTVSLTRHTAICEWGLE